MSAALRTAPRLLTLLCYGAMMSLAIGINLLPVYLTTISRTFGGPGGLTQEQLGRLGAVGFAGLVVGILITGPLADRWGPSLLRSWATCSSSRASSPRPSPRVMLFSAGPSSSRGSAPACSTWC